MTTNNNPYQNKRIEFHILQAFPVTCLNRDDVGSPKTALIGGTTRARVSSQCWKRQVRLSLQNFNVTTAKRTKLISKLVSNQCSALGATEEQAKVCGDKIEGIFIKKSAKESEETKSDTLLFLGPNEVDKVAHAFKEANFVPDEVIKQKDAKKQAKELAKIIGKIQFANTKTLDGLDIALFGRMIAQAPIMDVEAATSFNHAISTHKVTNEVEFFTALDDCTEEKGSAHMGSLEFNSATYYRYISLDLGQLYETMGSDEFMPLAISAFIKALYVAVPSARQTSQSGASFWDYAKVLIRKGQRLQLNFETAIQPKNGGYLEPSREYIQKELVKKEKLSGSLFGKIAEFEFGIDENFSIDNLIESVITSAKE